MTWAGVLGLVFYLAVFLPCCKGAKVDDYNVTHPEHIKAVLVLTLITFVSFSISIWPIWGWISLGIAGSVFMGTVMLANFVPNY